MAKTEFEEDDDGLPDTLGDLDIEEEAETKPVVNGSTSRAVKQSAQSAPQKVMKRAEPKAKDIAETKEPELTPEQQGQSLAQYLQYLEERQTNLEATILRLIQALKQI